MIKKIEAVCLVVEHLSTSRQFYEEVLGLTVASKDTGFVEYALGQTPLALFERQHAVAMFDEKYMRPPGGVVIALEVSDVAETCRQLAAKGAVVFEGPKRVSWGQIVAYLHDPDGNCIELTQAA